MAWAALLASYAKLNEAKFKVLHEIESALPFAAFQREQAVYQAAGRRALSGIEKIIPYSFGCLHMTVLVTVIVQITL